MNKIDNQSLYNVIIPLLLHYYTVTGSIPNRSYGTSEERLQQEGPTGLIDDEQLPSLRTPWEVTGVIQPIRI